MGNQPFWVEFNEYDKPKVRYYDPDTFELLEEDLPSTLIDLEELAMHPEAAFVSTCYSDDGNSLKLGLEDYDREKLLRILRDHSYELYKEPPKGRAFFEKVFEILGIKK